MREEVIPDNLSTEKKQNLGQNLCWKTPGGKESQEALKTVGPGREKGRAWSLQALGPLQSRGEEVGRPPGGGPGRPEGCGVARTRLRLLSHAKSSSHLLEISVNMPGASGPPLDYLLNFHTPHHRRRSVCKTSRLTEGKNQSPGNNIQNQWAWGSGRGGSDPAFRATATHEFK